MTADIIDVTDSEFAEAVVNVSHDKPVVVDFWASWCGPCQTLKPILENLAHTYAGLFRLAKVDVEKHQRVAGQFGVRGIPDVKVFLKGAVVDGFTGAVSEMQVKQMIEKYIVKPIDEFLSRAVQSEDPLPLFEEAFESFKDQTQFILAYGKQLLAHNKIEEAKKLLGSVPSHDPLYDQCQHMISLSDVFAATSLQSQDINDLKLKEAGESLYDNKIEPAMDALLDILSRDKNYRDGLARMAMIAVLALCKDKDIEKAYRRKFSMAINS